MNPRMSLSMIVIRLGMLAFVVSVSGCASESPPALNQQDHRVGDLPGWPSSARTDEQYAGYIPVDRSNDGHLFYWMFMSRGDAKKDPVVIWLNGGPGSSSMFGLLIENGPARLQCDGTLKRNPYSWNEHATVIWIDQPVGTGFSYTNSSAGLVRNETQVAEAMLTMLNTVFDMHPHFYKLPLFLTGESYAGMYIPAIALRLHHAAAAKETKIRLTGTAIGNGWTDPYYQHQDVVEYLWNNGALDTHEYLELSDAVVDCRDAMTARPIQPEVLYQACSWVENRTSALSLLPNPYDLRNPDYGCDQDKVMLAYLTRPDVRAAIHVGNHTWSSQSDAVYDALKYTEYLPQTDAVRQLLRAGYRMLFYVGTQDSVCSVNGQEQWLRQIAWSGQSRWRDLHRFPWYVERKVAGFVKHLSVDKQHLTLLTVREAGHFVPFDQPHRAQNMLKRFINAEPFCTPSEDGSATSDAAGKTCQYVNCPNFCSGRGTCLPDTARCKCDGDYSGDDCSQLTLTTIQLDQEYTGSVAPGVDHVFKWHVPPSLDAVLHDSLVSVEVQKSSLATEDALLSVQLPGELHPLHNSSIEVSKTIQLDYARVRGHDVEARVHGQPHARNLARYTLRVRSLPQSPKVPPVPGRAAWKLAVLCVLIVGAGTLVYVFVMKRKSALEQGLYYSPLAYD